MKKTYIFIVMLLATALSITGCSNIVNKGNKTLEKAYIAVEKYNTEVDAYNLKIAPYNKAAEKFVDRHFGLVWTIRSAQDVIDKGEEPFDEETLNELKNTLQVVLDSEGDVPTPLKQYDYVRITENATEKNLEALISKVQADTEIMKNFKVPDIPELPDYSKMIDSVEDAKLAYEDSIQGMKQITAPSDDFVIERLQKVDTITNIEAVSEDHDPNGLLNKQGGYIGCVYFEDTQVDRNELYIEDGKDNVIDIGCDGGGAIEIFNSAEEAHSRDDYLGSFDGTGAASGSHYVYGTIIVRTSDKLNGSQQLELTDKIINELIYVEH